MDLLTPEEIQGYKEIFDLVDTDRGGSIEKAELSELMDTLGMDVGDDEIELMMTEIDEDGDGEIDFAEFVAVMSKKVADAFDEGKVMEAFESLRRPEDLSAGGKDADSTVRKDDLLEAIMNQGNRTISKEQASELVMQMSPDDDGNINFEAFVRLMMERD